MPKHGIALTATFLISSVAIAGCGDSGGSAQRTKGDVKEAVGTITGDDSLKREGQKDQVVGGVKETVEDATDAVKDATN